MNPKVGVIDIFKNIYFKNKNFTIPNWFVISENDNFNDYDVLFQVNVEKYKKEPLRSLYQRIKEANTPCLVCESTPFRKNITEIFSNSIDSKKMYRLGWNHYSRLGKFNNSYCKPDRWQKIQREQDIIIKDWNLNSEGYILLCLQKPTDSSLNSIYEKYDDYNDWIVDTINDIRKYTNRKIRIRPHLKAKNVRVSQLVCDNIELSTVWKNRTIYEGGESLLEDFKNAHCVVSYNSNVLVESVCEGIPIIALSNESVAWEVSNKLHNIETLDLNINRSQWLYNTAYMVWTEDEILNGDAWNHLKGVYFK